MTSYVEEAPMGVQITWDTVDWQYVTEHVNKLQIRIAKAVKEEKHHLVKRLQYLLQNSFLAKLLAVRQIKHGKHRNRNSKRHTLSGVKGTKQDLSNERISRREGKRRNAHWAFPRCTTGRCRLSMRSRWNRLLK